MNAREIFLRHVAQTSEAPLAIEVAKARGSYLWDRQGKKYLDLIAGISVCNIGHGHPKVLKAIRRQSRDYLHVLVYGEMIESPQVKYAELLVRHLPAPLDSVYFTNSGAEAVEGAMKLAKRATGRTRVLAFEQSYHGSTQGALSILGDEYWRNAYRPLLPDILHLQYNSKEALEEINQSTACVVLETVQAERGVYAPDPYWIQALRRRCTETGTLLVLDEIQAGFGRTGSLWAFEQYGIVPDILLLGKALGGGLPLGAFIAERSLMHQLASNPVLGHITTFGGHPLSCAAGLAAFRVLLREGIVEEVAYKENLFRSLLRHPDIRTLRSKGLLMALELESAGRVQQVIASCLKAGLLTDWFLFAPHCIRIAPPLTIPEKDIRKATGILLDAFGNKE